MGLAEELTSLPGGRNCSRWMSSACPAPSAPSSASQQGLGVKGFGFKGLGLNPKTLNPKCNVRWLMLFGGGLGLRGWGVTLCLECRGLG